MTSRILVCDKDRSYIEALGAYFISLNYDMEITLYSSEQAFESDEKEYDLAMISEDFVDLMDHKHPKNIAECLYLADKMDDQKEDMATIYKFQQMSAFKQAILSAVGKKKKRYSNTATTWTGITSCCHHELSGLFSMAYAKEKSTHTGSGDVLFIDLESNSIMPQLMDDNYSKTITDYLYLLEGSSSNKDDLMNCFSYYDEVTYLAPAKYYGEIASFDDTVWEVFFESIDKCSFRQVVVLFDDAMRGVEELMLRLEKLVLISREGDYYKKYDMKFCDYLDSAEIDICPEIIKLPLNGKNLTDGSYVIDQLISGNLAKYVLKAG